MPDRPCTLRLYKLSFEQEEPIRRTAGGFRTCTADPTAEIILFTCDTDPALAGAELRIYDGFWMLSGTTARHWKSWIASRPLRSRRTGTPY